MQVLQWKPKLVAQYWVEIYHGIAQEGKWSKSLDLGYQLGL